ncbi:MAG TPA: hypothetical protein VF623_03320 [Segetibacter sp.]
MKTSTSKYLLLFLVTATLHVKSLSQKLVSDSGLPAAFRNAVALYNSSFATQLHVFNGKEYPGYRKRFTVGHPYFEVDSLIRGSVNFEGSNYDSTTMQYNLATDQLIILSPDGLTKMQLGKEKVLHFSILGHSFIHIQRDSLLSTDLAPGFYEVLSVGKISLFAKRIKTIEEDLKQVIELKVYARNKYYLKKANEYILINSKKAFLKEFADQRKAVDQYIRQNKFNYRKKREDYLLKVVNYYNTITR